MLSIIIGVIIIGFLIFFSDTYIGEKTFVTIFTIVILVAFGIGIFYPVKGYTDWELVNETKLVTLSNSVSSQGSGTMLYVSISADNVYSYRYEIDSEFKAEGAKSYKVDTISGSDIEEIEDANCTEAKLQEYHRKGKLSIWSFALLGYETKYVFLVPEGTISREIALK